MVQSFAQRALIDRLHGAVYARSTLEGGVGWSGARERRRVTVLNVHNVIVGRTSVERRDERHLATVSDCHRNCD